MSGGRLPEVENNINFCPPKKWLRSLAGGGCL